MIFKPFDREDIADVMERAKLLRRRQNKHAIKPLYLIIYKSPNQGSYEYICAMALSKLVNFDDITDSWSTSKEFLEKFNQKVINNRER